MADYQVNTGSDDDNSLAYKKNNSNVMCALCYNFTSEDTAVFIGEEEVYVCHTCAYGHQSVSIQDLKNWCINVRKYDQEETSSTIKLFSYYFEKNLKKSN